MSAPPALDLEAYNRVAGSGNIAAMADLVRRFVESRGGRVVDDDRLQHLARRHAGATGAGGAVVLSYRHLMAEVQACDWVDWSAGGSPTDGAGAASSSSGAACSSSFQATAGGGADCGSPGCPPDGDCCASSSGACAADSRRWSEFISSAPGPAVVEPSAPPADEADVHEDGGPAEVMLQEMRTPPFHDRGPVVVVSPPWGASYLVRRRPYYVVLLHPTEPSRGVSLFQTTDFATAIGVANAFADHTGLTQGGAVDPAIYATCLQNPEVRSSLLAACRAAEASGGASSSSSSAPAAGAAASSSSSAAASAPPAGDLGAADDCPICFCPIEASEAAMRCCGDAGVHHYFHSHCMQQWLRQCRAGHGATCPICRGSVQFHARRLDQFLSGAGAAGLAEEDRTFLQQCADKLRGSGGGWGEVLTMENAKRWGGIAAAAGMGFMMGYSPSGPSLWYDLMAMRMTREQSIAQAVGWVVGTIARIVKEEQKDKERRERREGGRRS